MERKNTVQKSIFFSTILNSLIILAVFSILISFILYHTERNKAVEIIRQRNYAVRYYIDGYFSEISNAVEFLSRVPGVAGYTAADESARQRILQLYRSFTELNSNITYIYSGYEDGSIAINDYAIPEEFDSRVRPWYKAALSVDPLLSIGQPYRDIISGEWLLTTGKALHSEDGTLTGVLSCDSSIEMMADLLNGTRNGIYKSSYSFVASPQGEIILHHNTEYLKKPLSDLISEPLEMTGSEGLFSYILEGSRKFAYLSRSERSGWIVITVVEQHEIAGPIARKILGSILITGLVALIIGFIQSTLLSRRFSRPIRELRNRVNSIVSGGWAENGDFNYPDNEIGIMAEEIGKLAGNELYRRSRELEKLNDVLREKNELLTKVSIMDQLTGLFNRRKMDEVMKECTQISKRYNRTFSLILIDIDFFKQINDVYGHQAGDDVLRDIAALFRENLRPCDTACRWGGEEFLILCPETRLEQAAELGRRLCTVVENHSFSIDRQVTISGGASEHVPGEDPDTLLKRADDNLYRAKNEGRNRMVVQN